MNKISININCSHFPQCSGCQFNQNVIDLPVYQEAKEFFRRIANTSFELLTGSVCEWRLRAKLAVQGSFSEPIIGLYQQNSHKVLDIPLCRVHHLLINQVVETLKIWIKNSQIWPYRENTRQGWLRYVQIEIERQTKRPRLCLVVNAAQLTDQDRQHLEQLQDLRRDWHSIWVNFNPKQTNTIFGEQWELLWGETFLWEHISSADVCFLPGSFYQANAQMYHRLVDQLRQWIKPSQEIVEYYAGVGSIGLNVIENAKSVKCCEISPQAQLCFEEAKHKLSLDQQRKIEYCCQDATQLVTWLESADCIIVDPPRKGLDQLLIDGLKTAQKPRQLIYVSCGWESLKRDLKILTEAKWRVVEAKGYLFFPGTNHIETLVHLHNETHLSD